MKKTKAKTKAAAPLPQTPEWLRTPEITYSLYAFSSDNNNGSQLSHEVLVTREEFCQLKDHLAKLRGIEVPKEAINA
jgi:hypothetical protein